MSLEPITIDFETEGIVGNPLVNPPRPVGVSIKVGDRPSVYAHGGLDTLANALEIVWHGDHPLIFHNAPFDVSVAAGWLGLPAPHWSRVHDTVFLVYLHNPHAKVLALKPSAERILGIDPEERDELREWVMANVKGATTKTWGAYICKAPVELVAPYAEADTDLTYGLYQHLKDKVPKAAYDLERELQPYLTAATRKGIRVDRKSLMAEDARCADSLHVAEQRIQSRLGCKFDVHNGAQLADALDKAEKISEWVMTPTGKRSTSRENLEAGIDDPELLQLLSYAGAMRTCLNTFIRGWLELSAADGRLHPSWNQVRDDDYGTRTGRLSCSQPNLQNVPNPFDISVPEGLCPIPEMRGFLLPEPGCRWVSRDFCAQEVRLLAHFEQGALLKAFIANPAMDPHQLVVDTLKGQLDLTVTRKQVKAISFGIIYGMGVAGMARRMKLDVSQAGELIDGYHTIFPGVGVVQRGTKARGKYDAALGNIKKLEASMRRDRERGLHERVAFTQGRITRHRENLPQCNYVETVGGRRYRVENPRIVEGRLRTFEYKLMNYLIQGSAADQTKRALLTYFRNKPPGQTFLCTVHDEINIAVPDGAGDMPLRKCMEELGNDGIDCPMVTTCATGDTWGEIK